MSSNSKISTDKSVLVVAAEFPQILGLLIGMKSSKSDLDFDLNGTFMDM